MAEGAPILVEGGGDSQVPAGDDTQGGASTEGGSTEGGDTTAAEGADSQSAEGKDATEEPKPGVYADWVLPESLTLEAPQTAALNNILGKYGLTQEAGQEIIDFGANVLKDAQEKMGKALVEAQADAFAETRRGFVNDFEKSAGNRRNTILNDAKSGLASLVPNEAARAELLDILGITGAGDHKAVINAFAALGKRMREQGSPAVPLSSPRSNETPADRRYGRTQRT